MALRLGDVAPNFSAPTTEGPIDFHQWLGNSWGVLFSHPADYTPVCTTELGTVARTKSEFEKRNVKVIALSVDPLESHQRWIQDINETQSCSMNFPVIADEKRQVATAYDMIHPNAGDTVTVRSVFVIGPDKRIKLTVTYPDETGRNFSEILRVIDSLQLTSNYQLATPADWQQGQDCVISPAVPDSDVERLFPRGVRKLKPYLRYTPQPAVALKSAEPDKAQLQPKPPHAQVIEMASAHWISRIVYVAAKLGLADLLAEGPKTAEELAGLTGTHAPSLYRLMRTLANLGILSEGTGQRFTLTPLGEAMKKDAPGCARSTVLTLASDMFLTGFGELLYSVQTGKSGFEKALGMPVFDWLGQNPEMASLFSETMVGVHGAEPAAVAAAYDFSRLKNIVDVGGATGNLLTTVLGRAPGARGILYDLPHVVRDAPALIQSRGLTDRVAIEGGSFFERVPVGADAYLLSHIIHDWSESQCLTILGNCRRAMKPDSRLLLIEMVLPPGNTPHPGKVLDMMMLVGPGGQERTEPEYGKLLEKAGFRLTRVVPTESAVSVIEAVPAVTDTEKASLGGNTQQPATNPNKALWEKGDFTRIAQSMRESGEALVRSLGLTKGLKVLDLGCGDGTTAIPEARLGADVVGVDIARNLVEAGNKRVRELGLANCRFQEGDATNLHQLKDQSFDLVVSIFGAMFAPKPFDVAREMVRVTRPGGRIVMGNWIPGDPTLVAQILKISSAYTPPPPPGFISPMTWGVESNVIERFTAAGVPKENISFTRDTYTFNFTSSPSELVAAFRKYYGPTMNAFEAAEKNGRAADLQKELEDLFNRENRSSGKDVTSIPATFLRVTVVVKSGEPDQRKTQAPGNGHLAASALNPSSILQTGFGFWNSKVLLTAVELGVFTRLAGRRLTGAELGAELQFHPRAVADFFDALVAMKFLDREGSGPQAVYFNTLEGSLFLDEASPRYIGGILTMLNARLFKFWNDLPEALRTGRPQNEVKQGKKGIFDELYADPPKLEQFMGAMTGLSRINFEAFADRFDFSKVRTLCDVGGATGLLSIEVAKKHPHLNCISFDLPPVEPIAKKHIAAAGLSARIGTASGDFFKDPLPRADIITMGMILHDWNLEKKMHLIRSAYNALPPGGALVAIEALIDDARRENIQGLLMSLNMLIEFGDAFDYSGADFKKWCGEVGFKRFEVIHLGGPSSAAVAYK